MPKKFDPMNQKSEEARQDYCDERAPGYDNKTKEGWLVGKGEDATKMPHYDQITRRSK